MLLRVAIGLGCVHLFSLGVGIGLEGQAVTAQADQKTSEGQAVTAQADQKTSFVKESSSRLSAKADSDRIRAVQDKATRWQKTKSEDDWLSLTDAIHYAAENSETKSEVTIDSSAGPGATVKYQTLGERKRNETPTTAKTPTESVEKMYIGIYHIWSVRNGKATSDENAQYEIDDLKVKVVLMEEKKKK
jgi:hypothetical protein